MPSLAAHREYLQTEWAAAQAAPLSIRKTLLVASLIDAYADRLFAADDTADDILVFRSALVDETPVLDPIFALCSQRPDGPRLVLSPTEVPLSQYTQLGVADFMVSLYNNHTVQRVQFAYPDGTQLDAQTILGAAIERLARA